MSDNLRITTGDDIAADDVSGVKYLQVKLIDGTADGTTGVPGDGFGLIVEDHPHKEIHEGDAYLISDIQDLSLSEIGSYLISVPATGDVPHIVYELEGTYGFSVDVYEGADRGGSNEITVQNRNRNSANTSNITVYGDCGGGTTDGSAFFNTVTGSGVTAGKLQGYTRDTEEWVLAQGTDYVLKITSTANSNKIAVRLSWYEAGTS